jgi:hypothetical protein
MPNKDVAAMQEAVENSMMVLAILNSEKPGDEFAYFMRPFCRKEMKWALANEKLADGKWSKIQPVVDVQDTRLAHLSSDLQDTHLTSDDQTSSMSRNDVDKILSRQRIQYNTTDLDYMAVAEKKLCRLLEAMAEDRMSEEAKRANTSADEEEEAKRVGDLSIELPDGVSYHFVLSCASENTAMADKLRNTLTEYGYKVCASSTLNKAVIDESMVVLPIISDEYLSGLAKEHFGWATECEKMVQPVVRMEDKTKISMWIINPQVPESAQNTNWVDLHPDDADYWACGIIKLLESVNAQATAKVTMSDAAAAASAHDKHAGVDMQTLEVTIDAPKCSTKTKGKRKESPMKAQREWIEKRMDQ